MKPLVSVVVPIYGVELYIKKCVYSLFQQTYDNIEFLFIDDCSIDGSIEILKSIIKEFPLLSNKIRIIRHETNRGLSAARETGISNANGKYLMHVDSDDYLDMRTVEKSIECAINCNAEIVTFGTIHEYVDHSTNDLSSCIRNSKEQYVKDVIMQCIPTNIWGKLILLDLYVKNDVHCMDGISYAEDYVILTKLCYYAKTIRAVNECMYHYVHYNSSSFTNFFKYTNLLDMLKVESDVAFFFQCKGEYLREIRIVRLKIVAWAIRKIIENDLEWKCNSKIIGNWKLRFDEIKDLSLNHNIILFLASSFSLLPLRTYILISNIFVKKEKR